MITNLEKERKNNQENNVRIIIGIRKKIKKNIMVTKLCVISSDNNSYN